MGITNFGSIFFLRAQTPRLRSAFQLTPHQNQLQQRLWRDLCAIGPGLWNANSGHRSN